MTYLRTHTNTQFPLAVATVAGFAVVVSLVCASCSADDCSDSSMCNSPSADQQQADDECTVTADVKDAPKCVDDSFGVFVNAEAGSDSNPGTKAAPVKTIANALTKLDGKQRLFLCGTGRYAEAVHVTSALSILGGFECASWLYDGSKAKISPNEPGYALHIDSVSAPVVVADLDISARNGVTPGASSVAVFVSRTSRLTLRRTDIVAGRGQRGADASSIAPFTPAQAPVGTSGEDGGAQTPNPACPSSIGGAGGNATEGDGADGKLPINPPYPTTPLSNGAGGMSSARDCNSGSGGRNGSYGRGGALGIGATKLGDLTPGGWMPAGGASGGTGGNGQGGGGGAQIYETGTGGSGGPGGCGGAGGGGGGGGGASIALLAFESPVFIEKSSLSTGGAGSGGNGAGGQKAQLGGAPGQTSGIEGCAGGFGGHGGSGGGGGGGAGGVSAGVLFKGTPPTIDGVPTPSANTLPSTALGAAGAAGNRGPGGEPARPNIPASNPGAAGTSGVTGVAKAVLAVP